MLVGAQPSTKSSNAVRKVTLVKHSSRRQVNAGMLVKPANTAYTASMPRDDSNAAACRVAGAQQNIHPQGDNTTHLDNHLLGQHVCKKICHP